MKEVTTKAVSRRQFMQLSAWATASAVMVACAPAAAPADQAAAPAEAPAAAAPVPAESAGTPGQYNEAPMLAELVQAGSLPTVDERLPTTPGVIPVAEQTGNYGGTFRRAFRGVSDRVGPTKCQDHGLVWYQPDLSLRAHFAESWEVNDDATEWTFHLREGMKWSDGEPFTTANFQWWYDNVFLNEELAVATTDNSANWTTGPDRTKMQYEAVDDYTIKITFAHPNPLFGYRIVRPFPPLYAPGHYMAQFHLELTEDAAGLEAKATEAGFETWVQYYENRNWWYNNPERPSLGPWIGKNELSEEVFSMERNPYYFGVDEAGNQLPYVDRISHRLFDNNETLALWVTGGEIDFQARHMSIADFTLYKENEAAGDYQVYVGTSGNHRALQLNLTTKNERLREFFNKRDVRIACSIAVDRETINELIYDGLATPRQYSPLSTSPQYNDKLTNAHIEYDAEAANALLDGAGYTEKNAEGIRLWPGTTEEISFIVEGTALPGSDEEDCVQQVVQYLAEVGLRASYKGIERSLYETHYNANEIEAAWWGGDRTVLPLAAPIIFNGTQPDRPWCVAWSLWRTQGAANPNAEEPPADHWIRTIWDTWDQIAMEPDATKQNELFAQILDIWAEELPMIGYLGELPAPIIVKNGIRNYQEGLPVDDTTGDEHLLNTETYFWEDPENHA